jgi:hypothetical protein
MVRPRRRGPAGPPQGSRRLPDGPLDASPRRPLSGGARNFVPWLGPGAISNWPNRPGPESSRTGGAQAQRNCWMPVAGSASALERRSSPGTWRPGGRAACACCGLIAFPAATQDQAQAGADTGDRAVIGDRTGAGPSRRERRDHGGKFVTIPLAPAQRLGNRSGHQRTRKGPVFLAAGGGTATMLDGSSAESRAAMGSANLSARSWRNARSATGHRRGVTDRDPSDAREPLPAGGSSPSQPVPTSRDRAHVRL